MIVLKSWGVMTNNDLTRDAWVYRPKSDSPMEAEFGSTEPIRFLVRHDGSAEVGTPDPCIDCLEAEVEELRDWIKELKVEKLQAIAALINIRNIIALHEKLNNLNAIDGLKEIDQIAEKCLEECFEKCNDEHEL